MTRGRTMSAAEVQSVWAGWRAGQPPAEIADALGRPGMSVYGVVLRRGGIAPRAPSRAPEGLRLENREEISRGLAARRSVGWRALTQPGFTHLASNRNAQLPHHHLLRAGRGGALRLRRLAPSCLRPPRKGVGRLRPLPSGGLCSTLSRSRRPQRKPDAERPDIESARAHSSLRRETT